MLMKALGLTTTVALIAMPVWPQHVDRFERERAQVMLQEVASDVRKYYYDPKLHGVDWDAKVKYAKEKIANATSSAELLLQIAAVLETLDDSHTSFIPPHDFIAQDYGWRFQMVGDHCLVTNVRPKSDADAKGVRPGDEVLTISGFTLRRSHSRAGAEASVPKTNSQSSTFSRSPIRKGASRVTSAPRHLTLVNPTLAGFFRSLNS